MRPIDEMLRGYERTVAVQSGLFGSFCWTVIRPALSDAELGARLGTNVSWAGPVGLDGLWEAYQPDGGVDSSAWVIRLDVATALLEVNGFAGSMPANLAALSSGGTARVVSFYWNELMSKSTLSSAVDGEVQQYDILDEDEVLDEVPALREAVVQVRAGHRGRSAPVAGLAMVEALTGVELESGFLSRSCPVVMFACHVEERRLSPEEVEQELLAEAYAAAPPVLQVDALILLIDTVARAGGLSDEPAVQRLAERMRRGDVEDAGPGELDDLMLRVSREPKPYIRNGKVDVHHPGFRRLQACMVLNDMLRADVADRMSADDGPLYHARWALDQQWPNTRAQVHRVLAQNTPTD